MDDTRIAVDEYEVLNLLTSLVDRSLVVFDEATGRYRLLETVRQYARDRLLEHGEGEQWRDRHLAHYLALAQEAEPKLNGPDQQAWLERLETEHDNLRAALEWSSGESGGGDSEAGLRLAGSVWWFWMVRGYVGEGRGWLSGLLNADNSESRSAMRARALNGAGVLAYRQGDYPAARALYEESLPISRELGDRRGIAIALNNLGNVACDQGDYPAARALNEQALALNRELGNRAWEAASLANLGNVAYSQGDNPSAQALHKESLAIQRELGDRRGIAESLNNLGAVACEQGDYPAAQALYEESLAIRQELGDRCGIAQSLSSLGNVACEQGDYPAALALLEESLAIFRELGDQRGIATSLNNLGNVAHEQGDYAATRAQHEESLAIRRALGDRLGIAVTLEGLAPALAALGSPRRAARIWGPAERLREEIGAPLPPNERPRYELQISAVRAAMDSDAAFDAAWQEGRAMTLEHAIELAMEARD